MSLITYEAIREAQRREQADQLQALPVNFFDAVKNWIDYKKAKADEISLREVESAKKLLEDIINRRQRKLLVQAIATVRGDVPPENLDETEKEFFERAVDLVKEFRTRMSDKILTEEGVIQQRLSEVSEIIESMKETAEPVQEIAKEIVEPSTEKPAENKPLDTVITQSPTETKPEPVKQEENLLLGTAKSVSQPKPASSDTNTIQKPTETKPDENLLSPPKPKNSIKLLIDLPKFVGQDLNSYGPFKSGDIIQVPEDIRNLLLNRKVAQEISI